MGLKILEFWISWKKNPDLFFELFVTKEKLKSQKIVKVFKFDNGVSEKNKVS